MSLILTGDTEFIRRLTEIIRANLGNESFGGKDLSRESGMSVQAINLRLRFILRKTVNQFIREIRLQAAMEMLSHESVTASEVAFRVGFGSPAYFNTCFSEYFGYPPGEVKKRILSEKDGFRPAIEVPIPDLPSRMKLSSGFSGRKIKVWHAFTFAATGIFLISILLFLFNTFYSRPTTDLEKPTVAKAKSIAVLPFVNDSPDPENVFFINGIMEAILNNLCKIKDLEVRPRTSVEQYRNTSKTIRQIGRECSANYIVEGSMQKDGERIILSVQLIDAKSEKHLFSERYPGKMEDIFALQSAVAIKVASGINAVITPEEKVLIEKPPTSSLAAYQAYLRGLDLRNVAQMEDRKDLDHEAESFFRKAIKFDSTFADPYVGLGFLYLTYGESDSAFYFADRALHFESKKPNAYALKGVAYSTLDMTKEAEEAFKKAIEINPNYSSVYRYMGDLNFKQGDSYKAIMNQLKVFQLENSLMQERSNLISIWNTFNKLGLYDEAKKYAGKIIDLNGDSSCYYWSVLSNELDLGNYKSVVETAHKIYNLDTLSLGKLLTYGNTYFLPVTFLLLRDYGEAYRLLKRFENSMKKQEFKIKPNYYCGFIYQQNGQKELADFHFEGSRKQSLKLIEQDEHSMACAMHLILTFIYAARGEKGKAIEHLRVLKICDSMLYGRSQITGFKITPMLDNIRQEPDYAVFIKNAESRNREEREKIEKFLRENRVINDRIN